MTITEKQRQTRRKKLGSSDAPAILGVSPWATATDVYWEKMAQPDDAPTAAMRTGNRLERPLIEFACEELGVAALHNAYRVSKKPKFLAAHLDALIHKKREAIEAKYVGQPNAPNWGPVGTDEVPEDVIVQVQHQMHVADLERVWVAAAVAGFHLEWRLYCVERHEGLIRIIVEAELAFWHNHVLPQIPPGPGPPPMEILRVLRREPNSLILLDTEEFEAVNLLERYQYHNGLSKLNLQEADEAKRGLLAMLGEHEAGRLPDGTIITYLEQRSPARCDFNQLRSGYSDAYEACVTQGSHRVLRIKKPKEVICDERENAGIQFLGNNAGPVETAKDENEQCSGVTGIPAADAISGLAKAPHRGSHDPSVPE